MDKCSNSVLILGQKAWNGHGRIVGEEICVLEAQIRIKGAVENHVGLVFNGMGGTH